MRLEGVGVNGSLKSDFEKPERNDPYFTQHTSNSEYQYRIAQDGYRH